MQNKDHLGYYTAGNYKTYSKLEAIEHSVDGSTVAWHYNDHVFDTIDWSNDPPGSLDFWYSERVKQLREQYDYVALCYSGGADSHNILMTFVQDNVYIDEIIQFHNLTGEGGDKSVAMNLEVFATSAPITRQLIETNPTYKTTKHTLFDITDNQTSVLTKGINKWDYWYHAPHYSPNNLSTWPKLINKLQEQAHAGKKVCLIVGIDKPTVTQDRQGHYNAIMSDTLVLLPTNINSDGVTIEPFYWTADMPQLPIKQAHVVMQYMKRVTDSEVDNYHLYKGVFHRDEYGFSTPDIQPYGTNNQKFLLSSHGLHRIIYKYWDSRTIVCPKAFSKAFSNRDRWFLNSSAPDVGQKYYLQSIAYVRNKIKKINPNFWWEYKFDPKVGPYNGGITGISKSYRLTK